MHVLPAPGRVLSHVDQRRLWSLLQAPVGQRSRFADALAERLARAIVVPATKVPVDVITMNSRVLCSGIDRSLRELALVYPWDADAELGFVSVLSDLGLAMLGNRIGARVAGMGLTSVVYQPEEAGDAYR